MFRRQTAQFVFIATLSALLLASVGISFAHDTGIPHTHDADGEVSVNGVQTGVSGADQVTFRSSGMPAIILIAPVGGHSSALHWLLHHISGQGYHDLSDWNHQHMHWHGVPHTHDANLDNYGGDPSVAPPQYE